MNNDNTFKLNPQSNILCEMYVYKCNEIQL